jgi:hypothetical protein
VSERAGVRVLEWMCYGSCVYVVARVPMYVFVYECFLCLGACEYVCVSGVGVCVCRCLWVSVSVSASCVYETTNARIAYRVFSAAKSEITSRQIRRMIGTEVVTE